MKYELNTKDSDETIKIETTGLEPTGLFVSLTDNQEDMTTVGFFTKEEALQLAAALVSAAKEIE